MSCVIKSIISVSSRSFTAAAVRNVRQRMHAGAQLTSPLTGGICDDVAIQSHPFTTNFLLQFGDICYLVAINPFLENAPNTVVNGV